MTELALAEQKATEAWLAYLERPNDLTRARHTRALLEFRRALPSQNLPDLPARPRLQVVPCDGDPTPPHGMERPSLPGGAA